MRQFSCAALVIAVAVGANCFPNVVANAQQAGPSDSDVAAKALHNRLSLQYRELDATQVRAMAFVEDDFLTRSVLNTIADEKTKAETDLEKFEAAVKEHYQDLTKQFGGLDPESILSAARQEEAKKAEENKERTSALYLLAATSAARTGKVIVAADALDRVEFSPQRRLQMLLNMLPAAGPTLVAVPGMQRLELAERLLSQASFASAADNFTLASKSLDTSERYAETPPAAFPPEQRQAAVARIKALKDRVKGERKQTAVNQQRYEKYKAGLDAEGQPKDGAAAYNAAVYHLGRTGGEDWSAVLPYLARCDRTEIATAANSEEEVLKKPRPETGDYLTLAEQWLAAAEASADPELFTAHATNWYSKAAARNPAGLEGLKLTAIQKKLQEKGVVAKAQVLPLGKWVDMTTAVDPALDTISGKWSLNKGSLVSQPGGKPSLVMLPFTVRKVYSYDLEVAFQMLEGDNPGITIFCPASEKKCLEVAIDHLQQGWSGIACVDGKKIHDNGTYKFFDIQHNKTYVVSIGVRDLGKGVVKTAIAINGKPFIQWEGKSDGLSPRSPISEQPGDFLLHNWNIGAEFAARIRVVEGEAAKLPR